MNDVHEILNAIKHNSPITVQAAVELVMPKRCGFDVPAVKTKGSIINSMIKSGLVMYDPKTDILTLTEKGEEERLR